MIKKMFCRVSMLFGIVFTPSLFSAYILSEDMLKGLEQSIEAAERDLVSEELKACVEVQQQQLLNSLERVKRGVGKIRADREKLVCLKEELLKTMVDRFYGYIKGIEIAIMRAKSDGGRQVKRKKIATQKNV